MDNRTRAAQGAKHLDLQGELGGDCDSEAQLIDTLANLMHFCKMTSVAGEFDNALRIARDHFEAETQ